MPHSWAKRRSSISLVRPACRGSVLPGGMLTELHWSQPTDSWVKRADSQPCISHGPVNYLGWLLQSCANGLVKLSETNGAAQATLQHVLGMINDINAIG